MHLPTTIDDDRKGLARIVAGLFALLGVSGGMAPQWIARAAHRAVALVLRPAESAVRRLIFFLSLTIRAKPATVRPMPSGIVRTGEAKANARPSFRLFDARLRLVRKKKREPNKVRSTPRISFFGDGEVRTISLGEPPKDRENDGLIASSRILRRLEAIKSALDDLPRQARRLARALQRRSTSPLLKLRGPLRPGHPPGHRSRRAHEIDDVLRRCHRRALEALPDTS